MSGHSKWHNIQARKGKQDAKRANLFTKYAKGITIAAQKGSDATTNFSLRLAIDKAKAVGMPKDNIDRAIKRGSGEGGEGIQMQEALYEAYGPGGVAILIKCVTDNKNRTLSEIKHLLSLYGGTFGSSGSVQWMFGLWGVATLNATQLAEAGVKREDFELALIEAGAEDIADQDEEIEIKTKPEHLHQVTEKLRELKIEPKDASIRFVAKDTMPVPAEAESKLTELFGELEEHDDVEDYFTNAG